MKQDSCNIFGRCRDAETGKLTKISELHRDLVGLGKILLAFTRLKANEAFYLSQDPYFTTYYEDDLIFDSNLADREPKLASFFLVALRVMPEVTLRDIRELIAKKFGEGEYSYDNAYSKMVKFNLNMEGGNLLIASLEVLDNGNYKFKIVPNTAEELKALIDTISNKKFVDSLLTTLTNRSVKIIDENNPLFTQDNPLVILDGLQSIIALKGGRKGVALQSKELAYRTGLFIVRAGEHSNLFNRLVNLLTKNPLIAMEILGDEYDSDLSKEGTSLEAALKVTANIIAKYLLLGDTIFPQNTRQRFVNFIQRLMDWLYTNLRISERDYYSALYDAKWTAYSMAKKFLGDNLFTQFNIEEDDLVYKHVVESLQKLHLMVEQSKDFGFNAHKNYKETFHQLMTKFNEVSALKKETKEKELNDQNTIFDLQKIELASAEVLMLLVNFLGNEIQQTSVLLQYAERGTTPTGEQISIAELTKIVKYSQEVLNFAQLLIRFLSDYAYIKDDDTKNEFVRVFSVLNEIATSYVSLTGLAPSGSQLKEVYQYKENYQELIDKVRRKIAVHFLALINGNEFIALAQHVSFKDGKLLRHAATHISVESMLETNTSTSFISRWIDSLADSPDILNLLIYDIIEQKKHEANKKTLDIKDLLFNMYTNLRKIGITDTRIFYETDSLGHLTGNLISERNWGEWERHYKEQKEKWEEQWYLANKSWLPHKLEMYHNSFFLESFGAWREGWHKEHSIKLQLEDENREPLKDETGKLRKIWAPVIYTDAESTSKNIDYFNEDYLKLKEKNPNAIEWLNNYLKLKKELDALLPQGSTNVLGIRAPQFTGTTTDQLTNVFKGEGKIKRIGSRSLRHYVTYLVGINPDDIEFGGENNSYSRNEILKDGSVIFTKAHSNALHTIERVPIYGVKKLPSLDDLSTDLIQSTLAYAAMAESYSCLSEVAEACHQIAIAKYKQDKNTYPLDTPNEILNPSGYSRLMDFMNQCVYNNYVDPFVSSDMGRRLNKILRRISGMTAQFGSLYMLGFNWHSAITNAYTGFNEIWKEAHAGEEFNKRDFIWAMLKYIEYCGLGFLLKGCNVFDRNKGSINESNTKMDLFFRLFDVLNENERLFREYHIQTVGYQFTQGYSYTNIAMLPYSVTDKWMQGITFLASARHTKLKNKTTKKECSLWDAYEVKKDEITGRNKLSLKEGGWLIYDKNLALLNKVLQDKEKRGEKLTTAESNAVHVYEKIPGKDLGLDGKPIDTFVLKKDEFGNVIYKDPYIPFDSKQENRFRIKCRGINNRMHGVYNRSDGGAFQKLAIASMAASMKKYAIGLIDRRFSATRYDERTREWRQGSVVTMSNILVDCFSTYVSGDSSDFIQMLDGLKYSDGFYVLGTAAKILYGITKFLYINFAPSTILGVDNYLRSRGFSDNQIANVRRIWADEFRPLFIKFMMSFLNPPDEDNDESDTWYGNLYGETHKQMLKAVDLFLDNEVTDEISEMLTKFYIKGSKATLLGSDLTVSDDAILTLSYLDANIKITHKNPEGRAFSIKAMLYYQLYRGLLEQLAYSITRPYSMFTEYQGLTDSALPGLTALFDFCTTMSMCLQDVDEEDLKLMTNKQQKAYVNGKEIYARGPNKFFYKHAKKLLRVSPMRSMEMWLDGYSSYEAMKHFKEPFDKEKYKEGEFLINRR